MSEEKEIAPIEARELVMPRVKRIKKMIDCDQLSEYFKKDFPGTMDENDERMHWMMLYSLLAAFDADITREAFTDLAVDILNMRAAAATCTTLQQVAINKSEMHLTDAFIKKSHDANRQHLNAAAAETGRLVGLIGQCRGQNELTH